jgi:hypothetical protein
MYRFLSAAFAVPLLLISASANAAATTSAFAQAVRFDPMGGLLIALAAVFAAFFVLPRSLRAVAGVLAVLVLCSISLNAAFAASIDIGQALNGSLQEIINGVVTAAIAALIGWVAIVIKSKFNIDIEARHREALTAFLTRQASGLIAAGAVKLDGIKVEVQSAALADAANKALKAIPDALSYFGLTPAALQQRIIDLLPKEPAVAQAQAVAIDAANPATPSAAAPAGL